MIRPWSTPLDILVDGNSISDNCPSDPQSPEPCPFTLFGMSGGAYMAIVDVPDELYFPTPWPKNVDLEIRLKGGAQFQGDLESDALRIDTEREEVSTMFVIDASGSMGDYTKMDAAKKAAHLILDAHIDYADSAGVVMFSAHAQTLNGPTLLHPSTTARQDLAASIDSLTPGGSTALGDGLFEAQDQLATAYDPPAGASPRLVPAMIVLSDGLSMCDWGPHKYYTDNATADGPVDPQDPNCDQNTVPTTPPWDPQGGEGPFANGVLGFKPRVSGGYFTPIISGVGVGPDADMEALGALASISGGIAFHVPSVAQVQALSLDLGDAFRGAFNTISGHQRVTTARVNDFAALPDLEVEPGTRELLVSVMTNQPHGNLVELYLFDPGGQPFPPERIDPDGHAVFRVPDPEPGVWTFTPGISGNVPIYMEQAVRSSVRLFGRADVDGGASILTEPAQGQEFDDGRWVGSELLLHAAPHELRALPGATVHAEITQPGGLVHTVALYDDGLHEDGQADDGQYAARFFDTATPGTYRVVFVADGVAPVSGAPFHRELATSVTLRAVGDDDGDGVPNWWEEQYGTNPDVPDGTSDPDQDGISNLTEFLSHSRPDMSDSDGGGESDSSEIEGGRNPNDPGDDLVGTPVLALFPGNDKLLVHPGVAYSRSATLEVQAARDGAEMVTVYSGPVPLNDYLSVPLPNDIPHCVRARIALGSLQSGWSTSRCGTPRLDPEAPTFDVRLEPLAACVVDSTATIHIDASDGHPELTQLVFGDGRQSFDPDAVASGVAEMKVVVDGNLDSAAWGPFLATVPIDLGLAASVNVGVQLRDAAGNESRRQVISIQRCD